MTQRNSGTENTAAKDFCEQQGISYPKFMDEIKSGELESILIGNKRMITKAQTAKWIERKTEAARLRNKTLV